MNTSRLNIVGEGRAGKTAFLGACRGEPFSATDSTIGVEQSLLEVNRVDMESNDRGGWDVVEDVHRSIMTAEEAQMRLAAEIALKGASKANDPTPSKTNQASTGGHMLVCPPFMGSCLHVPSQHAQEL